MSRNGNSIGILSFISAILGVTLLVGYILLGPSLIESYYTYIFRVILVSAGLELVAIVLGFVSGASRSGRLGRTIGIVALIATIAFTLYSTLGEVSGSIPA